MSVGHTSFLAHESVWLSVEDAKGGRGFEGQRGEDDPLLQYHEDLAEKGATESKKFVAHRYGKGHGGVETNESKAVAMYAEAAAQGDANAIYNLGKCCHYSRFQALPSFTLPSATIIHTTKRCPLLTHLHPQCAPHHLISTSPPTVCTTPSHIHISTHSVHHTISYPPLHP
jgi:TPR repeat protein